eukprot:189944-Prymnesium_polylepis.1
MGMGIGVGIGIGIGAEKERENHHALRVCVLVLLPAVRRANRKQPRSQFYPHLPAFPCGAARVCARETRHREERERVSSG